MDSTVIRFQVASETFTLRKKETYQTYMEEILLFLTLKMSTMTSLS